MLRDDEFGDSFKKFDAADYQAFELMVSAEKRVSELSDKYNFNFAKDEPAKNTSAFEWAEMPD